MAEIGKSVGQVPGGTGNIAAAPTSGRPAAAETGRPGAVPDDPWRPGAAAGQPGRPGEVAAQPGGPGEMAGQPGGPGEMAGQPGTPDAVAGEPGTPEAGHPRDGLASALRTVVVAGGDPSPPGVVIQATSGAEVLVDGTPGPARLEAIGPPRTRLVTAAGTHDILVLPLPDERRSAAGVQRLEVVVDGWRFEVDLESEVRARLRERATRRDDERARGGPLELRAIIPGRVISVDVADGDVVEADQRVLVLEAMKMQNELRAPRAGTIGRLSVGPGQTVELGDLLMVVE